MNDAAQTMNAFAAAIGLAQVLVPQIEALAKTGQISPEEQRLARQKYDALVQAGDAAFSGDEWRD